MGLPPAALVAFGLVSENCSSRHADMPHAGGERDSSHPGHPFMVHGETEAAHTFGSWRSLEALRGNLL